MFQILSVTCDNASNNGKMVEHLSSLIDNFPGAANQTRCFSHILNLVAKSVLRQFEVKKKTDGEPIEHYDPTNVLAELAQELELDEVEENDSEDENKLDKEAKGDDGELGDGCDGMSEKEVFELEQDLLPVQMMLSKASRFETQTDT